MKKIIPSSCRAGVHPCTGRRSSRIHPCTTKSEDEMEARLWRAARWEGEDRGREATEGGRRAREGRERGRRSSPPPLQEHGRGRRTGETSDGRRGRGETSDGAVTREYRHNLQPNRSIFAGEDFGLRMSRSIFNPNTTLQDLQHLNRPKLGIRVSSAPNIQYHAPISTSERGGMHLLQ